MTSEVPTRGALTTERHLVDNGAGFRLALTRFAFEGAPNARRPVLVVPGYGMNSFIFGFHPRGRSLVEALAFRGHEVWTVDLRGQGRSIRAGGRSDYGLAELAIDDLGVAIRELTARTRADSGHVDLVGASLGAALALAHVACTENPKVHAVVSLGGLVTWKEAHPLVRLAFGSPRAIGMIRLRNTRQLARFALPAIMKLAPSLLSVYLNPGSTDLSQAHRMVQTVEDPHPGINREIAEWIRRGDLWVRGTNVSSRLPSLTNPFMCVVAAHDGIVPPATARHAYDVIGSTDKRLLIVGDAGLRIAHGDLFLCHEAEERVFAPIASFLAAA